MGTISSPKNEKRKDTQLNHHKKDLNSSHRLLSKHSFQAQRFLLQKGRIMGQSTSTPSTSNVLSWAAIAAKKPARGNLTDADFRRVEDGYLRMFNREHRDEALNWLDQEQDSDTVVHPNFPPVDKALAANEFFSTPLGPASEYLSADTDPLHPIFEFKNFDTLLLGEERSRKAWQEMRPALALISKWLSAPEARKGYWHRLLFGNVVKDAATGRRSLYPSPVEADFPAASTALDKILLDFAAKICFNWIPSVMPNGAPGTIGATVNDLNGSTRFVNSALSRAFLTNGDAEARKYLTTYAPRIGLSTSFLYHLLCPIIRRQDRCTDLRFQMGLAKTLCHEICHALYASRGGEFCPEPRVLLEDEIAEVGVSWDFFLSGARFHIKSGKWYIGRLDARTRAYLQSHPGISVPVPMDWVEKWFRKETWTPGREGYRRASLWGRVQGAEGVPGPEVWMCHRYQPSGIQGKPGTWREVLHRNRRVVAPKEEGWNPGAPVDWVPLEKYFDTVVKMDKEKAEAEGFDPSRYSSAFGRYKHLASR